MSHDFAAGRRPRALSGASSRMSINIFNREGEEMLIHAGLAKSKEDLEETVLPSSKAVAAQILIMIGYMTCCCFSNIMQKSRPKKVMSVTVNVGQSVAAILLSLATAQVGHFAVKSAS